MTEILQFGKVIVAAISFCCRSDCKIYRLNCMHALVGLCSDASWCDAAKLSHIKLERPATVSVASQILQFFFNWC